eukprot:tig00000492_g1517.t1
MVLPSTGPVKFSQVRAEYGLSGPFKLGATGRGLDTSVPQSGAIRMSDFLGRNWYPKSGLQLWLDSRFPSSYPGSGSVWYDISGYGRNFSISGLAYDAANKRMTVNWGSASGPASSAFGINTEHTVEVVCHPTQLSASTFMNFQATDGTRMILLHLPWDNSNAYYDVRGCCDAIHRINYGMSNVLTRKHFVFRTKTSSYPHRQIYENGIERICSYGNGTSGGYTWGGPSLFFSGSWLGYVHLIRLWNRPLSDAEITQSYNAMKDAFALPALPGMSVPNAPPGLGTAWATYNSIEVFFDIPWDGGAPIIEYELAFWASPYTGNALTTRGMYPQQDSWNRHGNSGPMLWYGAWRTAVRARNTVGWGGYSGFAYFNL